MTQAAETATSKPSAIPTAAERRSPTDFASSRTTSSSTASTTTIPRELHRLLYASRGDREFRVTTSVAPAEFGRAGGAILQHSVNRAQIAFTVRRSDTSATRSSTQTPSTSTPATLLPHSSANSSAAPPAARSGRTRSLSSATTRPTAETAEGLWLLHRADSADAARQLHRISWPERDDHPGAFTSVTGCPKPAADATVVFGAIYDPTTCEPFSGNIIPSGRINSAGLNYFNAFDHPRAWCAKQLLCGQDGYPELQRLRRSPGLPLTQKDSSSPATATARTMYVKSHLTGVPSGFASGR